MLKGADISKWQGTVNFDLLRDAIDFIIIRTGYGVGYTDPQYVRNRDEARRVGLLCGFYHYAYPNNNAPEAEADSFLNIVGTPKEGEILVLDFEEQFSNPVDWCLRFLDRVTSRLNGYKPMIYLNLAIINQYDWKPLVDANYGLWLARWDYNATAPAPMTDWPVVAMRQWSNHEKFPGVTGDVDANTFYGTTETFKAYGYSAPVADVPSTDPHLSAAITLLEGFQTSTKGADGTVAFGNVESAVRGLLGAYTDLGREKENLRLYKEAEAERVEQLIKIQVDKVKLEFATEMDGRDDVIDALATKNLSEIPWRLLLSWGWKNFWKAKRGG